MIAQLIFFVIFRHVWSLNAIYRKVKFNFTVLRHNNVWYVDVKKYWEKNWEIHHFWLFCHFYPFICNVWYFRCHFWVSHPRKPLFWCIICQCWEIKKISFFSNFSNIFMIFSKPSWWSFVNFDSWCNIQNNLLMFCTKFQLVSSYFRIMAIFGQISLDYQ